MDRVEEKKIVSVCYTASSKPRSWLATSKVICVEKNTEKTSYMFMSPEQSAGQSAG